MQGCLKLVVGVKNACSYMEDLYFSAPFKVMNISPPKVSYLDLMVMSSSPGMLDQDNYEIDIRLKEGSRLNLFNQAYQRIYPSSAGTVQNQVISLASGSTLIYLSTPLVPHRDAHFTSRSRISLADNATLIIGEILTCGRLSQEHPFAFELLKLDFEVIFLGEGLIYKERQHIIPVETNSQQMGLYHTFTHQASLYVFNNRWNHALITEELREILLLYPHLAAGVTPSWKYGTVVKVLGYKAEELVQLLTILKDKVVNLNHQNE